MTHPCAGPVVTRRWVEPHGEERSERVCLRCGRPADEAEPWVVPVACDGCGEAVDLAEIEEGPGGALLCGECQEEAAG